MSCQTGAPRAEVVDYLIDLKVLLRRLDYVLVGRSQSAHDLGVGELQEDTVGEVAEPLVLLAAKDEDFVLKEGGEATAVKGDAEVLGFGPQLLDDVVVKTSGARQQRAEAAVVERLLLVLLHQLLAEQHGALPHLAAVEQVDAVDVERLLELAVRGAMGMARGA